MSVTVTHRERPPLRPWEDLVSRLLWRARLLGQRLAAPSAFTGWRWLVYRRLAVAEERWSRRVTQADLHLTRCASCEADKMHVILRPGATRWTNLKVCFGCQAESPHQSEH